MSCLYIDDSGTRNPDETPKPEADRDWFALGGIMFHEEDVDTVIASHAKFCAAWEINYPLHSSDIRHSEKRFSWLATLAAEKYQRFMTDLTDMLLSIPVLGHACVIDRPGYDSRYRELYGRQTWMLCKTAFSVLCERAAKIAHAEGRKLRVYVENGDKSADSFIRSYYAELRAAGMPFKGDEAAKYKALEAAELAATLYDLKFKGKGWPPMQLADIFLYPLCRGGYEPTYRPLVALREGGKLIDSALPREQVEHWGVKYSCFGYAKKEAPDTQKPEESSGLSAAPVTGTS